MLNAFAQAAAEVWGNPSSIHHDGQMARKRVEEARREVASLLGCGVKDVVFTSGGTEADNLALLGVVRADERPRKHVITSAVEHPAVLAACARLERDGVGYEATSAPEGMEALHAVRQTALERRLERDQGFDLPADLEYYKLLHRALVAPLRLGVAQALLEDNLEALEARGVLVGDVVRDHACAHRHRVQHLLGCLAPPAQFHGGLLCRDLDGIGRVGPRP